tara:strand:- start:1040 stop:1360 length:321 start_codon:yes stop_codon:yes gene_type:complete
MIATFISAPFKSTPLMSDLSHLLLSKEFVAERQREILEIEAAQGKAPAKEGEEGLLNWEIYEKMHEDESFFNFMFPEIHSMKIAGSVEDQLLDPTVFEEIVQYEVC